MISKPIITTEQLSIGYANKTVFKDLNLKIAPQKLTAIIGTNGIGKSTLLRTLAGLQNPLTGNITLAQKNIDHYSTNDLSKLRSVVLANENISQNLTVEELITLGRQPFINWLEKKTDADFKFIKHAIQQANLEQLIKRPLHTLSDGQRQRALIARAFAQNAQLLFLDEPLAHLDLHHKAAILKLLKKQTLHSKTIIFCTHDIQMSLQICDYIIILHDNNTIYQGTPEFIINNNILNKIFPKTHILFDPLSKKFDIVK